jgi:hypothetical protein
MRIQWVRIFSAMRKPQLTKFVTAGLLQIFTAHAIISTVKKTFS